ncbi:MAG: aspartyl protease family protein [Candidatus Jacksonbacteria bacterium]|nr:aspartyl protease family protein [Candidatus Jacksonbacteria bacterium]
MALTYLDITIANPARPKRAIMRRFLIDSGATYSVVPKQDLQTLGIKPHSAQKFILANGEEMERKLGVALFEYKDKKGGAPVIFGEPGDSLLLGAVTLEALGVILDPIRRELKALPMVL